MIWVKREFVLGREFFGLPQIVSPALECRNTDHCTAHGTTHLVPRNRRSRMQDCVINQRWDCLFGGYDIDQHRVGLKQALDGLLIGGVDPLRYRCLSHYQSISRDSRLASRVLPRAGGAQSTCTTSTS